MNPSMVVFIVFLLSSVIMSVSANSWYMVWLGMEINIMSFLPLIMVKANKYSNESAMKYFLVQSLGSMLIMISIFSLVLLVGDLNLSFVLIALMLKLGAAPSHMWLPSVCVGLSWFCLFMLLTVQKIGPLFVSLYLVKLELNMSIMKLYIIFSAVLGSLGGVIQVYLRKILAFSSISHLSWMLAGVVSSSELVMAYLLFYSIISFSLIFPLSLSNMNSLSQMVMGCSGLLKLMLSVSLLSLSGLPPFSGFLPKLMILSGVMGSLSLFFVLLLSSTLSLFFYLRLVLFSFWTGHSASRAVQMSFSAMMVFLVNLSGLPLSSVFFSFLS